MKHHQLFGLTLALSLITAPVFATTPEEREAYSASRKKDESWQTARANHMAKAIRRNGHGDGFNLFTPAAHNAQDVRHVFNANDPANELALLSPLNLTILTNPQQDFEKLSDTSYITDGGYAGPGSTLTKRRISFLYPDDGCFARASLMANHISEVEGAPVNVGKIFAFGNLNVSSVNADPSGSGTVTWWYHVAPIARIANNNELADYVVIDPSLDPAKPLSIAAWLGMMGDPSVSVSYCTRASFSPTEACYQSSIADHPNQTAGFEATSLQMMQSDFLPFEWQRQQAITGDADKVLGPIPLSAAAAIVSAKVALLRNGPNAQ